ncbi:hypothetical protein WMY93_027622 [Mugilogobius chulae]|uniref:Uncharacterized protein n=1 Tax=Mugilogobius chulae TaxID=88201 RepID=A0AAW0MTH1_9GOBI
MALEMEKVFPSDLSDSTSPVGTKVPPAKRCTTSKKCQPMPKVPEDVGKVSPGSSLKKSQPMPKMPEDVGKVSPRSSLEKLLPIPKVPEDVGKLPPKSSPNKTVLSRKVQFGDVEMTPATWNSKSVTFVKKVRCSENSLSS